MNRITKTSGAMSRFSFCLFLVLLFFPACKKHTEINDIFSKLNGNIFILKVDRISQAPQVQFPRDSLQESDYTMTNEDIRYEVAFTEDGQAISINAGSVSGKKTMDSKESRRYELDYGLFAGGRFIIWINKEDFEAEYTVYGSGIPIIRSERGKLLVH